MRWRDAVLASLNAYSHRHRSRVIDRQSFVEEEMGNVTEAAHSSGATPTQTLSRILQELRDDGLVEFLERGQYLLLDAPIDAESEDFTDEALDVALKANKLKLGRVETADRITIVRQRKGQDRLRRLVVADYAAQCAVCDVADRELLIASHIIGWAESAEHRGDLANVICLCRIHDALFERGYWSLGNDYQILKRTHSESRMIRTILDMLEIFRAPAVYQPASRFLEVHRGRFAFHV